MKSRVSIVKEQLPVIMAVRKEDAVSPLILMEQKQEPRQDTRGMVRRMMRNNLAIVKAQPAKSPSQVVFQWAEESGVKKEATIELLERLRRTLPFEEDGCLRGGSILDALEIQATLMRDADWAAANKLRLTAEKLREQFTRLGLL